MRAEVINIALQGDATGAAGPDERYVRLEPFAWSPAMQYANFFDLYQMLTRARSGLSAWSYIKDDCPISVEDGIVTVALPFYSYPSGFAFQYSVSASIGDLGEWTRISQPKEFDLVLDHESRVILPFVVTEPQVEWASPAFDREWRVIARPTLTVDGGRALVLSEPCWGVVRIRCMAEGYLHTVRIRLVKETSEEDEDGNINTTGYKITNLQCTAIAAWQDEEGQSQTAKLDLEVPKCVEDYLATCPDGEVKLNIVGRDGKTRQTVYYSTCTGNVIQVINR